MKTKLFLAGYRTKFLALLIAVFASLQVWGETETLFSLTGSSSGNYSIPSGWTATNVTGNSYLLFNSNGSSLTSPLYEPHDNVSLTFSVATYGGSNGASNHRLVVRVLDEDGTTQATYYTATPTSTTYVSTGSPIDLGDIDYSFKIQFYLAANNKGVRLRDITLTGDEVETTSTYTLVQVDIEQKSCKHTVHQRVTTIFKMPQNEHSPLCVPTDSQQVTKQQSRPFVQKRLK